MELIDREKIEWYGCNFETPRCESENRKCSECSHAECSHAQVMQLPSIKVPDNPTNGDIIKAVFPNASVSEIFPIGNYDEVYYVLIEFANCVINEMRVMKSWWNAPYKGVEEYTRVQ